MNNYIISKHNSIVKNDDIVIHLGDISAGLKGRKQQLKEQLMKLNGRKILLRGNHDYESDNFYIDAGFEKVGQYMIIKDMFLNHYALEDNEYTKYEEKQMIEIFKTSNCTTIVHGHSHTRLVGTPIDRCIN